MPKFVYFFGGDRTEGDGKMKDLLGGKGAGLAEMTRIGLPVPTGFTITTEVCDLFYRSGKRHPKGLAEQVERNLALLEAVTKKRFGDSEDPLLVSVRSGAGRSMPGMMETILNLGLNDRTVEALAAKTHNPRFAYDAYRRFLQMYSSVVIGLSKDDLEQHLHHLKAKLGVKQDQDIPAADLKALCETYKGFFREETGADFPQDPRQQLWGAIGAVFGSWMADKAVTYRRVEKITNLRGTAVNVCQMVFGNKGESSGTGVCFTRDPNSGENVFYGDFLINAQGEDVVAGIRTPLKLSEMDRLMPEVYRQLCDVRTLLEKHYRDMQDLEFTVEEGRLYMLQCRAGKRSPAATFKIAADLTAEGLISKSEAVNRITADDIERSFYPILDPKITRTELLDRKLAAGINAVPGAAAGKIALSAQKAEEWAAKGERVILVRRETSPEDVGGMHAAQGILTATGGKTSHAAVVARGWGKCCVVGCEALQVDYGRQVIHVGGRTLAEGEPITLDGSEGMVYAGEIPLVTPTLPPSYFTILEWCDGFRTLGVRTNADTPYDAKKAREMGAEGIGLCRTEHMFFDTEERRLAIQEMIIADTKAARKKALEKLLPFQRQDFIGIFEAMAGLPVTIRLIDPPLHEFVPHEDAKQLDLAVRIGVPAETVRRRVEQLHEANPMLGHRGCRLAITYPEILEMQVRAIMEAAVACYKRKIPVLPEIMHPLVLDRKEFDLLEQWTRAVADETVALHLAPAKDRARLSDRIRKIRRLTEERDNLKGTVPSREIEGRVFDLEEKIASIQREKKAIEAVTLRRTRAARRVPYLVGTMIELPRAALLAGEIAARAEFFSFGTNDLTQTTLGLSRDDAGKFLPEYVDEKRAGILKNDPFQSLDQEGVGLLIRWAIAEGRKTRPKLKVGICGEHGGDPASVRFCHEVGMDYVSCSPYRVPIARLAAAQSAIAEKGRAGGRTSSPSRNGRAGRTAKPRASRRTLAVAR